MNPVRDTIVVQDLEVWFRVGVPDEERAQPQRLLLCLEMESDFRAAAASDNLGDTIDYFAVTRHLLGLGEGRSWRLIETLAQEIAELILRQFGALAVTVEVRKFIMKETRYVAARVHRSSSVGGVSS